MKTLSRISLSLILTLTLLTTPFLGVQATSPTEELPPESGGDFSPSPAYVENLVSFAPRFQPMEAPNLSYPSYLEVTRPAKNLTTTLESYFITGTSFPEIPLFWEEENEEIPRQGTGGLFGLWVTLKPGKNTFTFTQEEHRVSVIITRETPEDAGPQKIRSISLSSMVPSGDIAFRGGDTVILSCVAPAGSSVTAEVDGQRVTLEQVAVADPGIPATFRGSLILPKDIPVDKTTSLGAVQYFLTYNEKESSYTSLGDIYVMGENAQLMGRVSSYYGYLYDDPADPTSFKELLKKGAGDYIVGQSGGYYQLASGGYIPQNLVDIVTEEDIFGTLSSITYTPKKRGEYYYMETTETPAYHMEQSDTHLTLTLYNTTLTGRISLPETPLFSHGTVEEQDGHMVITWRFKHPEDNFFWGYNVVFGEGKDVFIEFQYKPRLVRSSKPLKNLHILLDPGHGGSDAGASGPAGALGPTEKDLNLAHAQSLKKHLEALGASVTLTRGDDQTLSLDQRLQQLASSKADYYLSLHHNSIDIHRDANDVAGTECYYFLPDAQPLATSVSQQIAAQTGRRDRGAQWSYYRVTISPYAPSALLELGFTSHPVEYEEACDSAFTQKLSGAVASGFVQSLQ